jgi:hypothetical protein
MPNYLQLPAELQALIEKRDAERRAAQRRAEESETPSDGDTERRQNGDRRTLERREEDAG